MFAGFLAMLHLNTDKQRPETLVVCLYLFPHHHPSYQIHTESIVNKTEVMYHPVWKHYISHAVNPQKLRHPLQKHKSEPIHLTCLRWGYNMSWISWNLSNLCVSRIGPTALIPSILYSMFSFLHSLITASTIWTHAKLKCKTCRTYMIKRLEI